MTKKILIIIPDKLSVLVEKGEIVSRYYNPDNIFSEVHILMLNEDSPEPKRIQQMVGSANLFLYNAPMPPSLFKITLGYQFPLLRTWLNKVMSIISTIKPDLIRTYENVLEGYIASQAKNRLGMPYVTSLHSLHGKWDSMELNNFKTKIYRKFTEKIEKHTLRNADAVICVYSAILNYARSYGARNLELIHNFVGGGAILSKESWNLSNPIKLITVNRQLQGKNPENIIKALALLPYAIEYTLVGDGVLHDELNITAKDLPPGKAVRFIKSLPNSELCSLYHEYDFMLTNCHFRGVPKSVIEAGLSGLPIIVNRYVDGYKVSEYNSNWIAECDDTPEGYADVLDRLIQNAQERELLGKGALEETQKSYSPKIMESKVADVYKSLLTQYVDSQ